MAQLQLRNTGWEWWIRPKATYCNDRLWVGGIDDMGHVRVDVIQPDNSVQRIDVADFGFCDDHNSAALIARPGKVPLLFYVAHNAENVVRYRRGTDNADDGCRTLGAQSTLSFGAAPLSVTYVEVQTVDDVVHLWTRVSAGGVESRYWGYARSSDWAQTWDVSPVKVFDLGALSYLYTAIAQVSGADEVARIAMAGHPESTSPNHNVYYCEASLTTGDITLPGSPTVIGNLFAGTGLPLSVTSALQTVRTAPGGMRSWIFDVSTGTNPEVVWAEFNNTDISGTGTYYYGVYTGGTWVVNPICGSGAKFAENDDGAYLGSAHFTNQLDGEVIVSREDDGEWFIERWHTTDNGATWATTQVDSSSTAKLVRPFGVEGAGDWQCVYQRITHYGEYTTPLGNDSGVAYLDWTGSVIVSDG